MNKPDIPNALNLLKGEKKITLEPDTKVPNAWKITILKEDETLTNMLSARLKKDANVLFVGVAKSHPLWHTHIMRVQTTPGYTAREALQKAVHWLTDELETIQSRFEGEESSSSCSSSPKM